MINPYPKPLNTQKDKTNQTLSGTKSPTEVEVPFNKTQT